LSRRWADDFVWCGLKYSQPRKQSKEETTEHMRRACAGNKSRWKVEKKRRKIKKGGGGKVEGEEEEEAEEEEEEEEGEVRRRRARQRKRDACCWPITIG
jgi:hypothetical protein